MHDAFDAAGRWLLSPAQRQAALLLRQACGFYRMGTDEKDGARVITLPGEEDTIRGVASVDLLLLDEASRIKDDLYLTVLPMIAVTRGRQMAMSTPKGKRGWFWDAWCGADGQRRGRPARCPGRRGTPGSGGGRPAGAAWSASTGCSTNPPTCRNAGAYRPRQVTKTKTRSRP